jgi:hypothetical protein
MWDPDAANEIAPPTIGRIGDVRAERSLVLPEISAQREGWVHISNVKRATMGVFGTPRQWPFLSLLPFGLTSML